MRNHSAFFRLAAYIWFSAFLSISCIVDLSPKPFVEKEYHSEVLWKREIFGFGLHPVPLIDNKYCYFPSNYSVLKIDLETGKVLWESERIQYFDTGTPQKIGEHIYLPENSGLIFVYNDSNGKLAATIRLGNNETDAANYAMGGKSNDLPATVSDSWLFWGNNPSLDDFPRGLMRLDSREIDFSKDPEEIQSLIPDLAWFTPWRAKIFANMLSENGIIYFLTEPDAHTFPGFAGVLAALDVEANETIWERNMPLFEGYPFATLVLHGENIIAVEQYIFCGDKSTGNLVYLTKQTRSPSPLGFNKAALYDNHLYYKNGSTYNNPEEIVSVNAGTGELVGRTEYIWDPSSPQVYGDKLYVLNSTGLRVYHTMENGYADFIGVDKSFNGDSWSYTVSYKDTFIFVNKKETYYDSVYLTAIRCK